MSTFLGRTADLARLSRALEEVVRSGRGQLLAVRGRRQVGKSALLTRFVEAGDIASVYMTAIKGAPSRVHLQDLADGVTRSSRPAASAGLFDEPPTTWSDAFQRLAVAARDAPLVVVLDEYPWAAAADPALDGRIQVAWDRTLEALPVLLVLVGSDLAVMERTVAHDAPLYGRARPLIVEALTPADTGLVLPGGTPAMDVVDAYLVTGGYPRLVRALGAAGGVRALVEEATADAFSELVVTAQLMLDVEVPSGVVARSVLESVGHDSRGPAVFGTITDRLQATESTARTQITRGVETLQQKRLLAVDLPVGAPESARRRRYRITDPYLRFWLRFVGPVLSDIERGRGDLALAAVDRGWSSWRGRAVEPVVHEALRRSILGIPALTGADRVGGWWDRLGDHEVDVVVGSGEAVTGVGTVKWRGTTPVSTRDMRQLSVSAAQVGDVSEAVRIAVCPAGVDDGVDADVVWTADDVVGAWRPR